ncbi:hypothetical protein GGS26DRAFT_556929 [Hypomontagnella submonticulosa]|nr:hypothetical protein GGS26DRAFT_556929 [Hypomontagnella submonticulosa]
MASETPLSNETPTPGREVHPYTPGQSQWREPPNDHAGISAHLPPPFRETMPSVSGFFCQVGWNDEDEDEVDNDDSDVKNRLYDHWRKREQELSQLELPSIDLPPPGKEALELLSQEWDQESTSDGNFAPPTPPTSQAELAQASQWDHQSDINGSVIVPPPSQHRALEWLSQELGHQTTVNEGVIQSEVSKSQAESSQIPQQDHKNIGNGGAIPPRVSTGPTESSQPSQQTPKSQQNGTARADKSKKARWIMKKKGKQPASAQEAIPPVVLEALEKRAKASQDTKSGANNATSSTANDTDSSSSTTLRNESLNGRSVTSDAAQSWWSGLVQGAFSSAASRATPNTAPSTPRTAADLNITNLLQSPEATPSQANVISEVQPIETRLDSTSKNVVTLSTEQAVRPAEKTRELVEGANGGQKSTEGSGLMDSANVAVAATPAQSASGIDRDGPVKTPNRGQNKSKAAKPPAKKTSSKPQAKKISSKPQVKKTSSLPPIKPRQHSWASDSDASLEDIKADVVEGIAKDTEAAVKSVEEIKTDVVKDVVEDATKDAARDAVEDPAKEVEDVAKTTPKSEKNAKKRQKQKGKAAKAWEKRKKAEEAKQALKETRRKQQEEFEKKAEKKKAEKTESARPTTEQPSQSESKSVEQPLYDWNLGYKMAQAKKQPTFQEDSLGDNDSVKPVRTIKWSLATVTDPVTPVRVSSQSEPKANTSVTPESGKKTWAQISGGASSKARIEVEQSKEEKHIAASPEPRGARADERETVTQTIEVIEKGPQRAENGEDVKYKAGSAFRYSEPEPEPEPEPELEPELEPEFEFADPEFCYNHFTWKQASEPALSTGSSGSRTPERPPRAASQPPPEIKFESPEVYSAPRSPPPPPRLSTLASPILHSPPFPRVAFARPSIEVSNGHVEPPQHQTTSPRVQPEPPEVWSKPPEDQVQQQHQQPQIGLSTVISSQIPSEPPEASSMPPEEWIQQQQEKPRVVLPIADSSQIQREPPEVLSVLPEDRIQQQHQQTRPEQPTFVSSQSHGKQTPMRAVLRGQAPEFHMVSQYSPSLRQGDQQQTGTGLGILSAEILPAHMFIVYSAANGYDTRRIGYHPVSPPDSKTANGSNTTNGHNTTNGDNITNGYNPANGHTNGDSATNGYNAVNGDSATNDYNAVNGHRYTNGHPTPGGNHGHNGHDFSNGHNVPHEDNGDNMPNKHNPPSGNIALNGYYGPRRPQPRQDLLALFTRDRGQEAVASDDSGAVRNPRPNRISGTPAVLALENSGLARSGGDQNRESNQRAQPSRGAQPTPPGGAAVANGKAKKTKKPTNGYTVPAITDSSSIANGARRKEASKKKTRRTSDSESEREREREKG